MKIHLSSSELYQLCCPRGTEIPRFDYQLHQCHLDEHERTGVVGSEYLRKIKRGFKFKSISSLTEHILFYLCIFFYSLLKRK